MTSYTFAHYVILMMPMHNVLCQPKTETTGKGEDKLIFSANADYFITKIFLAI